MEKLIFITGASRGIGFALAKQLLDKGHRVIGASRTGEVAGLSHPRFEALRLDLADSQSIREVGKQLRNRSASLDFIINNAASGADLRMPRPEEASFRLTMDINLTGTVFITEALLPLLSPQGKIINISSKMGSIGLCKGKGSAAYRISKAALNMYTKILSNELAPTQSIATLHPGWVRTSISSTNSMAPLSADESAEGILDFILNDFESGAFWDVEDKRFLEW